MKIIVNILKYIFIVLLVACIICIGILNIASSKILSKDYILSKLESTNYYEELSKEAQEIFEQYIGPSGFDDDVMDNIVSVDKIKKDTNIIINNIYDGTNVSVDTEELETNLRNNINKSIGGRSLTATETKAVDQFISNIAKQYTQTLTHTDFESSIYGVINKVNSLVNTAKMVLIVAIIVLVIIIIAFNMKHIWEAVSNIGIAFTSSGLFYIILNIYMNSQIKISNLNILNNAFSNALKGIASDVLSSILVFGIILLVLGLIAIVFGHMKDSKYSKNKSGKRSK